MFNTCYHFYNSDVFLFIFEWEKTNETFKQKSTLFLARVCGCYCQYCKLCQSKWQNETHDDCIRWRMRICMLFFQAVHGIFECAILFIYTSFSQEISFLLIHTNQFRSNSKYSESNRMCLIYKLSKSLKIKQEFWCVNWQTRLLIICCEKIMRINK